MLKPLALSLMMFSGLGLATTQVSAEEFKLLKQISAQPTLLKNGEYKGNYYVPSTLKDYLGIFAQ